MPGFDGTGPRGQGPMTGGGRGYCVVPANSFKNRFFGRRFICGRGGGRGRRNWFYATGLLGWMRWQQGMPIDNDFNYTIPTSEELTMLKDQAVYIKEELEAIQSRIQELETKQEAGQ